MSYSVRILPRAENDLERMYDYISTRSPEGAERWLAAFEVAIGRLKVSPFLYVSAKEDKHFAFELRQFVFKTPHGRAYRTFYSVDENTVSILRVCGPAQAPLAPEEFPKQK